MSSFSAAKDISAPLEHYLSYLQNERGTSLSSLRNYRSDLYRFRDFIADYRLQQWSELQQLQVQAYILSSAFNPPSLATIKRRTSSLRGFFNFLRKRSLLSKDPLLGIKLPRDPIKMTPPTPAIDPIALMSFSAPDFITKRDKTMLAILLHCGLSVADLSKLTVFSIDFSRQKLLLQRSSKQLVSIAYTPEVEAALKDWLQMRMAITTAEQSLFISKRGQSLSIRALQLSINRIGKQQGFTRLTAKQLQQSYKNASARQVAAVDRSRPLISEQSHLAELLTTYQQLQHRGKRND